MHKIIPAIISALALLLFLPVPSFAASHPVINEVYYDPDGVDTGLEWIKIYNPTGSSLNLTGYDLNASSGDYFTFPSFNLSPNEFVTVHWRAEGTNTSHELYTGTVSINDNMGNTSGWVALFTGTTHSTSTIIDYIEYGAGGKTWESTAVDADNGAIWTAGNFVPDVPEGKSIKLKTNGADNNSPSDWAESDPTGPVPSPSPSPSPSPRPSPSLSPLPTSSSAKSTSVSPSPSPQSTGITTRLSDAGRKDFEEPVLGIQEATHSAGGEEAPGATEAGESSPKEDLVAGFTGRNILAFGLALAGLALLGFSSFSFLKGKPSDKMETHE